ncbi:MAG: glycosyltransferase family 4 protein [Anaerolineae bacterium]|nr:glycosyltransferase family 4 protein [Anaerolineae bacterium]
MRAIAEVADVVVATQIRNRQAIERAGKGQARVVYLDTERVARPLWRLGLALRGGPQMGWLIQNLLEYLSYLAFEMQAARRFGAALRRGDFDVVHRLTPMNTLAPSPMARGCSVPFVVGPLNDNLPWPPQSTQVAQREVSRLERLVARGLPVARRLPYLRATFTEAEAILAGFEHTIASLPAAAQPNIVNYPDIGFNSAVFNAPPRPPRERMTVLCVGRLVPLKQPEVVVRAVAASEVLRRHRLVVVGDGPERPALERLIADHGLAGCVELVGQKSQAEVGQMMREADILAFPSLHELGANAVVEAMASGLVCVVFAYGGPATLITPERGIPIPPTSLPHLADAFKQALESLVMDPARTRRLAQAAYQHAMTYYTWEAKARKAVEVYRWVLGQQAHKPDFWAEAT